MKKHLIGLVLAMCVAPWPGAFAQSSDDAAGDLPDDPAVVDDQTGSWIQSRTSLTRPPLAFVL